MDFSIISSYVDVSKLKKWLRASEISARSLTQSILGDDKLKYTLGVVACLAASCSFSYYLYKNEYNSEQARLRRQVIQLSTFHLEIERAKLIRLTSCLDNIHLSTAHLADVHFMFSCAVSDKSGGMLTMHEFSNVMRIYESYILPGMIPFRFRLMDRNHHGAINFLEFVEFIQWLHAGTKEEVLIRIFETADIRGTGSVSPHDLYWALLFTNPVRSHETENVPVQDWDRIIKHLRLHSAGGGENSQAPVTIGQWLTLTNEPDVFSFSVFNEFARQTSSLFGYLTPKGDSLTLISGPPSPTTTFSPSTSSYWS